MIRKARSTFWCHVGRANCKPGCAASRLACSRLPALLIVTESHLSSVSLLLFCSQAPQSFSQQVKAIMVACCVGPASLASHLSQAATCLPVDMQDLPDVVSITQLLSAAFMGPHESSTCQHLDSNLLYCCPISSLSIACPADHEQILPSRTCASISECMVRKFVPTRSRCNS